MVVEHKQEVSHDAYFITFWTFQALSILSLIKSHMNTEF